MILIFLILISPFVTFFYVVFREDYNTMQKYREMKSKMSDKDRIKRLFS